MTTNSHQDLVNTYLAMWNETDRDARRALGERVMTAEATYVDPMADVAGLEAMSELIASVQAQFPGHRFELHTQPEAHHDRLRFRWALVPDGGEPVAIGLDVAELEDDGRIVAITGFLDPVAG
jgi:SnoaL-like domain